jgi:hypothetical protein
MKLGHVEYFALKKCYNIQFLRFNDDSYAHSITKGKFLILILYMGIGLIPKLFNDDV